MRGHGMNLIVAIDRDPSAEGRTRTAKKLKICRRTAELLPPYPVAILHHRCRA